MKSVVCRLVKALSIKKLLSVVKFRLGKNSNWEKISQFEFFPGLNLTTENNYYGQKKALIGQTHNSKFWSKEGPYCSKKSQKKALLLTIMPFGSKEGH